MSTNRTSQKRRRSSSKKSSSSSSSKKNLGEYIGKIVAESLKEILPSVIRETQKETISMLKEEFDLVPKGQSVQRQPQPKQQPRTNSLREHLDNDGSEYKEVSFNSSNVSAQPHQIADYGNPMLNSLAQEKAANPGMNPIQQNDPMGFLKKDYSGIVKNMIKKREKN